MPGRWKPPKEDRVDAEIVRRKRLLAEKLNGAAEWGSEEEFVAAVKEFRPDVGKEELKEWIMLFRAVRREKRGL